MPKIFVSHASADKPLVDELFDLLQTGCDLRLENLLCSSVEGAGVSTGDEFITWINTNLCSADLIILLLTPNYYASKFCLAEMGAAWALQKDVFPLVLPTLARDPGVLFLGRQAAHLDSPGLDDLRDRVSKYHSNAAERTARWSIKKKRFLEKVDDIILALPQPALVEWTKLVEEQERTAAATQLYSEADEEIRELKKKIRLLENAKDAEEVRQIKAQFEPVVERYNEAVKIARSSLYDLSRVEVRAVYSSVSGDEWTPSHNTSESWEKEIEKAVKSKWLIMHEYMYDHTAYTANRDHPRLQEAFEALDELRTIIAEMPEDIRAEIEQENGFLLELANWQFWDEALLYLPLLE